MTNKLPMCKCGCGERVSKSNNKYIWGHNAKDIKLSKKTREKMRQRILGKTYVELYGEEKAKEIKAKLWKKREKKDPPWKGKTWDEMYGIKRATEMKLNLRKKHKLNPKFKDRKGIKNPNYKGHKDSLYSNFSKKITDEKRKNKNNKIEVRCSYCSKWFIPTPIELDNRIYALNNNGTGRNFYCSNECKVSCPDFYQVLWPKNYKPYESNPYKMRVEVYPEIRKMVLERDKWECQKCGNKNLLECHHIDPVSQKPILSNDIDSCITLCKECHKFIHTKIEGCKYHQLRQIC